MKKKIVAILLTIAFVMGFGSGCNVKGEEEIEIDSSGLKTYHVKSIDKLLKYSFMYAEENRIDAYYPNKNYDMRKPHDGRKYIELPHDNVTEDGEPIHVPEYRIIFMTEQKQLEDAFEEVPEVDLETKMVMAVLFSNKRQKSQWIENIKVENGNMEIIMAEELSDITPPYPIFRSEILVLDKMEITDAEITWVKRNR